MDKHLPTNGCGMMHAGFEHTTQSNLCSSPAAQQGQSQLPARVRWRDQSGKTSLVRALLGLPQEPTGHRLENATRCAAASAMPVPGPEGLKIIPASPLLVDTPGMFDADSNLADCAVRYLGNCLIQMHMISCSLLCLIL